MSETAEIADGIFGDKLYQDRARRALPILVRYAEAGRPLIYMDLSRDLSVPNARNMNYVLGSVGRTLADLSKQWGEEIPPLQCLVVNKTTRLPGIGANHFLTQGHDFSALPKAQKRAIVDAIHAQIFRYPRWREVLSTLALAPERTDYTALIERASRYGGGESEAHRFLKEYVAANPNIVGLSPANLGTVECRLPSGDCIDVSFDNGREWIGVEVKSHLSPVDDVLRGLYQCVKYRAVMEAVQVAENKPRAARSILVLGADFPKELIALRNLLGIEVISGITPSSKRGTSARTS
jgi:hypothetical protein